MYMYLGKDGNRVLFNNAEERALEDIQKLHT